MFKLLYSSISLRRDAVCKFVRASDYVIMSMYATLYNCQKKNIFEIPAFANHFIQGAINKIKDDIQDIINLSWLIPFSNRFNECVVKPLL